MTLPHSVSMPLPPQEFQAATKMIEDSKKLLLIPHANVDPDGLSSVLAAYAVFTSLGKDCTVICPDTLPQSLKFLPNFESLETTVPSEQQFVITLDTSGGIEIDKLQYTVEDHKVNIIVVPRKGRISGKRVATFEEGSSYDLIVVLDSAELPLLGTIYSENVDLFNSIPILNVDHHVSNTKFGQMQLIDPNAASATEVLYLWFTATPQWKEKITPDIATLLLTGLITDTRSFQNPNTTPRSLEIAANLLDLGARQQEIIQHVYKTKPLSTLKIWGRALNRIQVDPVSRIVWSLVSREDLQEMGATSKETHGILDELISTVPDADVHALFTEVEEGGCKVSLRSGTAIDVNLIAGRLFGGGGHARAAGFRLKQYGNFQLAVVEAIEKMKEEMRLQREEAETVPKVAPALTQPLPMEQPKPVGDVPPVMNPQAPSIDVVEKLSTSYEAKGEE